MHLHQLIHVTPVPVSCISVHRFSLFSVSIFFHNHKKIQIHPGWTVHNVTHTCARTLWCQFLRFSTRTMSNSAQMWLLRSGFCLKKIWIDKIVIMEIITFVFDLLELCAWGHSSLEHQLGWLRYNRVRVQTGHSQHLVIPAVTDDKPFEYEAWNTKIMLLLDIEGGKLPLFRASRVDNLIPAQRMPWERERERERHRQRRWLEYRWLTVTVILARYFKLNFVTYRSSEDSCHTAPSRSRGYCWRPPLCQACS